jgi:hypothetical protein
VPDDAPQDSPPSDPVIDAASLPDPTAAEATTPGGYSYTLVDDMAAHDEPKAKSRGGVPILVAAIAAIILAAIVGGAAWLLASSGGGGSSTRVSGDVTTLLNAFTQGQSGTTTTRYEAALPPGYPGNIPTYPGAKLLSSVSLVNGEDVGYFVIYDTKDSRDKVAEAFNTKLAGDPWQITGGQDGRDTTVHQFSKIDDSKISGFVLVASSKDSKTTTILESVQVTSGAKDAKAPAFSVAAPRSLPDGFPDAIPAYKDATLIESAYQKKAGAKSYAASFITKGDASGVLDFYRSAFKDGSLTVQDIDTSSSPLKGAEGIQFTDAKKTLTGGVTVGEFPDDASYTRIDVTVQVSKASSTP